MKKILFISFILLCNSILRAADYGLTSYPVLMIDSYSARSRALANSTVSHNGDINDLMYNPASIATLQKIVVAGHSLSWLFDTSFNNVIFGMPLPTPGRQAGVVALSFVMMGTPAFDLSINGSTLQEFAASDFSLGLTYANNIFNPFSVALAKNIHIQAGLTVKYVQTVLADYRANMLALDAGLLYGVRLPNLTTVFKAREEGTPDTFFAGFSFRNLAIPLQNRIGTTELSTPWYFDFGLSYMVFGDIRHVFLLSTALEVPSDNSLFYNAGLEYSYKNTIFLRGGYKVLGRQGEGLSLGVGLNFEIADHLAFKVDYAMDILAGWDARDTFSVSILF